MKILIWNMNYWENTKGNNLDKVITWKNACIEYFKNESDIDFFILQEINPIKLFEKNYNQYNFSMIDYNILYHELTSELLYDGRRDNFWGNAIIYHKKYKLENKNGLIDFSKSNRNYYGRSSLMCYEFLSNKNDKITIINYYNKINYANKGKYIDNEFNNDEDIKNIIEKTKDKIILAGDFNKGFNKADKEKYNEFIELYNNKYNLIDSIPNYSNKFVPTSVYSRNGKDYLNDFCFTKNITGELVNKKDEWENIGNKKLWKGLSDHRALIIDLKIE